MHDDVADRWLISDFAFASFPGTNFYECIGGSDSPYLSLAGPWALYALPVDSSLTWTIIQRWRCGIIRSLAAPIILR